MEALWPAPSGWQTANGSVRFARRPGESTWTAVVDGLRPLDRGRRGLFGQVRAGDLLLRAATPRELARRLAEQRGIHCLLARGPLPAPAPRHALDPSVQVE